MFLPNLHMPLSLCPIQVQLGGRGALCHLHMMLSPQSNECNNVTGYNVSGVGAVIPTVLARATKHCIFASNGQNMAKTGSFRADFLSKTR